MRHDSTVFVTGAGGFIGGWVIEHLWMRGFKNLRAGVRNLSGAARIARFPVDVLPCDILDPRQTDDATKGCDVVIHCAAGSTDANILGTENICRSSLKEGVTRLVHLSSVSVYGNTGGLVDESCPMVETGSTYGDSKIEAERICQRYAQKGLAVVILRPTVVYGPYNTLWIEKFAQRLLTRKWHLLGELGEGDCNPIYVTDLIQGIMLASRLDQAVGGTFNMNGPEIITWNKYFSKLNSLLGLPPLRPQSSALSRLKSTLVAPVKTIGRKALATHGDMIRSLYRKSVPLRLAMKRVEELTKTNPGHEELDMFGRRVKYSIESGRKVLGYNPVVGIDKGLELSVDWLKHETLLDVP